MKAHKSRLFFVEIMEKCGIIVTGAKDGSLKAWPLATLQHHSPPLWTFTNNRAITSTINACAVDDDKGFIIIGTLNDGVFGVNAKTGAKLWSNFVSCLNVCLDTVADRAYIAYCGESGGAGQLRCMNTTGDTLWLTNPMLGRQSIGRSMKTGIGMDRCAIHNCVFVGSHTDGVLRQFSCDDVRDEQR